MSPPPGTVTRKNYRTGPVRPDEGTTVSATHIVEIRRHPHHQPDERNAPKRNSTKSANGPVPTDTNSPTAAASPSPSRTPTTKHTNPTPPSTRIDDWAAGWWLSTLHFRDTSRSTDCYSRRDNSNTARPIWMISPLIRHAPLNTMRRVRPSHFFH